MSFGLSLPAPQACGVRVWAGAVTERSFARLLLRCLTRCLTPSCRIRSRQSATLLAGWFWTIFDDSSRRHVLFKRNLSPTDVCGVSTALAWRRPHVGDLLPSSTIHRPAYNTRSHSQKIVVRDDAIRFAGAIQAWILHFVWPHGRRHPPVLRRAIPLRPMLGQDGP